MPGNNKNGLVALMKLSSLCLMISSVICLQIQAASADAILPHPKAKIEFVTFYDPPYIFNPANTHKQGLVQIILKHLMQQLDIEYNLLMMPPKRAELYVQATPNSCILPIEKSQEREVLFAWVSPIVIARYGLFQLEESPSIKVASLEDARPYRLGSYLGSAMGDYLSSFGYEVDYANDNDANIHKLQARRIDLWVSDTLTANHVAKVSKIGISESRMDFFTSLKAIGCHLGMDKTLIERMKNEVQAMYHSGEMYNLVQKFKANNY